MKKKIIGLILFFLFCLAFWFGLNSLIDGLSKREMTWKNRVQQVEQSDSLSMRPSDKD